MCYLTILLERPWLLLCCVTFQTLKCWDSLPEMIFLSCTWLWFAKKQHLLYCWNTSLLNVGSGWSMYMDGLPLGEVDVPADQKMLLLTSWPDWITESLIHRVYWHAYSVVLETLKNEQPDTPFFPSGFWVKWDGYLEESCAAHLLQKCRGDLWSKHYFQTRQLWSSAVTT